MNDAVVISPDTEVGSAIAAAAVNRRSIFFAGLPGVGKSLFLQQQTLMAANAGRQVHLLQWDLARQPFETPVMLEKYPETDGASHPAIRKAVGLWARNAVQKWHAEFSGPEHLLLGEVPIVGNRFVELLQKHDDSAEELLASDSAIFLVPVPSKKVREEIEAKRQASIANPQHANESRDAPINILQDIWREARSRAIQLGLVAGDNTNDSPDYDPVTYARLYEHMLRHRRACVLQINKLYPTVSSVYELGVPTHEITAAAADIAAIFANLENNHSPTAIRQSVENWHQI